MTEIDFDLNDLKISYDVVINIDTNLRKKYSDFRLQELFRIHSKTELQTDEEFYIDVRDYGALQRAVDDIIEGFCTTLIRPQISDKLREEEKKAPSYVNGIWMIAFAYNLPLNHWEGEEEIISRSKPKDSDSWFGQPFKEIHFENVEEFNKDDFNVNVDLLENYIRQSLMKMNYGDACVLQKELLQNCVNVTEMYLKTKTTKPLEAEISRVLEVPYSMAATFLIGLAEHYEESNGKHPFQDFELKVTPVPLQTQTVQDLWKRFSKKTPPLYLNSIRMIQNITEDVSISLKKESSVYHLIGAILGRSTLSQNMRPDEKFEGLNAIFRRTMQCIIKNKMSSFFLSDARKTLFFQLPIKDGTWENEGIDTVRLINAPLKYLIFDHTKESKDVSVYTLQTMIGLSIFDKIRKFTKEGLGSLGNGPKRSSYYRLDTTEEDDGYNEFFESFIEMGFKDPTKSKNNLSTVLYTDRECANNDQTFLGNKRQKIDEYNEHANDEIGELFPTHFTIDRLEYMIAEKYSNPTSTKIYVPVERCLNHFHFRYNVNLDKDRLVFIKVFEIYWLSLLHGTVREQCNHVGNVEFTDSDYNIMSKLEDDFEFIREWVKFSFLRELIALRRVESWNECHPKECINTAKVLQYVWGVFGFLHHTYGGPYIAFENLEFINRNDISENTKRIRSFKQQKRLLERAGIKHNDLERRNICFDYDDNCFIIDFDSSTVDGDEIFNKYDISDLDSP